MNKLYKNDFLTDYKKLYGNKCLCCDANIENYQLLFEKQLTDKLNGYCDIYQCSVCRFAVTYPLLNQKECAELYDDNYSQIPTGELDMSEKGLEIQEIQRRSLITNLYFKLEKYFRNIFLGEIKEKDEWIRKLFFSRLFAPFSRGFPYYYNKPLAGKMKFLDFGCGQGQLLEMFPAKTDFDVWGIDINPKSVEICRRKGLNVIQGDESSLKDKDYDFIHIAHLLEHIAEPQKLIIKFGEHLKNNGILIIVIPNFNPKFYWLLLKLFGLNQWMHLPYHRFHWNKDNIKLFVGNCGFEPIKVICKTPAPWKFWSFVHYFKCRNKNLMKSQLLVRLLKLSSFPLNIITDYFNSGDIIEIYCRKIIK